MILRARVGRVRLGFGRRVTVGVFGCGEAWGERTRLDWSEEEELDPCCAFNEESKRSRSKKISRSYERNIF